MTVDITNELFMQPVTGDGVINRSKSNERNSKWRLRNRLIFAVICLTGKVVSYPITLSQHGVILVHMWEVV